MALFQGYQIFYPAPDPIPLMWMTTAKELVENEKKAEKIKAEIYEVKEGEYLVVDKFKIYHVLWDRDMGSCACPDWSYKSGEPAIPPVPIILVRNMIANYADKIRPLPQDLHTLIETFCDKVGIECKLPEIANVPDDKTDETGKVINSSQPPHAEVPSPKSEPTVYVCSSCHTDITSEQRATSVKNFKKALCVTCISNLPDARGAHRQGQPTTNQNPEAPKEPEVLPTVKKPLSDKELSKLLDKKEDADNKLQIGKCEAVAAQYGIPKELANLFFMSFDSQLYIKNPGLLYLAGKKGYSRIDVTDKYDKDTQEWTAECKIYPKLTKEILESIGKLDKDVQKAAFEFASNPTNGIGRASKSNVRMSSMHNFLREMAQTRAQNRALRVYTGYGSTSYEELSDSRLENE